MRGSGKTIKLKDLESTSMSMVHSTRVSGSMIYNTVSDEKHGSINPHIWAFTIKVKKMELVNIYGAMDQSTLENGYKIVGSALVNIPG